MSGERRRSKRLWTTGSGTRRTGPCSNVPTSVPQQLRGVPFTTGRAKRLGVTARMLAGSRFRGVLHGVHVCADVPDSALLRLDAALLLAPRDSFATHHSAAAVWGLPVCDPVRPHVGVGRGLRAPQVQGVSWHAYASPPSLRLVDGRLVGDPAVTFVQLAGTLSLLDAVIAGDALTRRGLVRPGDLVAAAAGFTGVTGLRVSRAAALVRPRVDSPMETWLRLLIVAAGLPEPVTNLDVHDANGRWIARPDLLYPAYRVAIEYDGRHHDGETQRVDRDVFRNEDLAQAGWFVLIVHAKDLYVRPARTLERLVRALRNHGCVLGPVDDAWRYLGRPCSTGPWPGVTAAPPAPSSGRKYLPAGRGGAFSCPL